jgi:hypothetical protein
MLFKYFFSFYDDSEIMYEQKYCYFCDEYLFKVTIDFEMNHY